MESGVRFASTDSCAERLFRALAVGREWRIGALGFPDADRTLVRDGEIVDVGVPFPVLARRPTISSFPSVRTRFPRDEGADHRRVAPGAGVGSTQAAQPARRFREANPGLHYTEVIPDIFRGIEGLMPLDREGTVRVQARPTRRWRKLVQRRGLTR